MDDKKCIKTVVNYIKAISLYIMENKLLIKCVLERLNNCYIIIHYTFVVENRVIIIGLKNCEQYRYYQSPLAIYRIIL